MYKKTLILAIGLILKLGIVASYGQGPNLTKVIPPSPTASAFQKYGDIPVSAYTGVPDITIPLCTVKFRDITIPITLSYHASGIKVSEEASQVGLGWVINAGGNITRNIIGYDDFDGSTYFTSSTNPIIDFSDGQGPTQPVTTGCVLPMFNRSNPNAPTVYNYDLTSYLNASPAFDFQPDQYYYNFQGHSGKFLLKRNRQAVIQNQEKIQLNPAADGSTWQAKTADGTTYDFTVYESYHDNEFTTGGTAATHITGWYLTKITSPLGNTVTLTYTANSNYVQPTGSYSETRDDWDYVAATSTQYPPSTSSSQKGANPGKQYNNLVLSTINFTNGIVKFNYSLGRIDLPGDYQLDSVSLYEADGVTLDKTFALGHSYFTGTLDPCFNNAFGVTSAQANRLMLTSVTETGYFGGQYIQNPPYTFTYNSNSSTLPAKTSFARDHWGYYNGVLRRTTLIPDPIPINATSAILSALGIPGTQRDPSFYFAKAFALTQINYPSGGYTQFDYEMNDFDLAQSEVNDFSWFSKQKPVILQTTAFGYDIQQQKDLSASDILDLTDEYTAPDGSYPSTTVVASFRLTGGTGANCNDIQLPSGVVYYELVGPTGAVLSHVDPGALNVCNAGNTNTPCVGCQTGQPVFSYTMNYSLAPGKYTWRWYVNPNATTYLPKLQDMHATYSWYSQIPPNNTNIYPGGGLRILRITDHDGINEKNNKIRKYSYHYWADKTNSGVLSEYTYGRRMSPPQYTYFKMSYDDYSINTGSACVDNTYYSAHLMRSSDSEFPINGSAKGSVVGYDQVTELLGENGEYGKKVYQYINNPDVVGGPAEPYSGLGLPEQPSYGSTLPDMTNGSLLQETDYASVDGNFVRVKSINNTYSTVQSNENIVYGLENRQLLTATLGDRCGSVVVPPCGANQLLTYQSLKSDWNILTQTEEKRYDQRNQGLLEDNVTSYYYDNPAHMQLTRTVTTNSKGELLSTHTQYPLDFTNTTGPDAFSQGVANLQKNFVVTAPVEKYTRRSNSDGSNLRTTRSVLTTFNATTPTPALLSQTETTSPITSWTAASTSASGSSYNANYQPVIAIDAYDGYGNILQQHKVGDGYMSYIWNYNASLPIAEVHNAAQADIAYTSFEAGGTGGWTFNFPYVHVGDGGLTGQNYYDLNYGACWRTGLNPAKTYIVSYWSYNGAYSVTGSTKVVTGKTSLALGFTYFEHTVSGVSAVYVSGQGPIDELRLYPATAQMRTLTYSPLLGVTSECDAGDKINYYYYDALGRLRYIKDQDGNIVKTIEYHLKGQTGN